MLSVRLFSHIIRDLGRCGVQIFVPNRLSHSIKVAVVGSGPAGFYTSQKLLKNPKVEVDIYERLPVPFGLVRYGVAPDHAEVKNVINSFTSVANSDRVNFYGNVSLGDTVSLDEFIKAYHAVVLCYGSAQDKMLGIEGEKTVKNILSARDFVGWYNGVPENKSLDLNLDCDTACIIGHGNVALDCARILLKPANLGQTDITSFAHKRIAESKIRRIYIVGRRGPVQVSFSTKELREMINLDNVNVRLDPENIFQVYDMNLKRARSLSRQRRRLTELLLNLNTSSQQSNLECIIKFMSKPVRLIGHPETNQVVGLEVKQTKYASTYSFVDEDAHPEDSDENATIDCGLVIRSIGYKAAIVDKSLPMNHSVGSILNTNGRIHGHKSLYCSGWLATGAVGVIAGTLNSSILTAQSILDDIDSRQLPSLGSDKKGHELISNVLRSKRVQVVHFSDWLRIDELERRLGEALGKSREKIVDVEEMLGVVRDNKIN